MIVSVIIPTYNYGNYICFAIDSVLIQLHTHEVEIIVVDDGSTDDTEMVLQSYINTGKIKYFYQQNNGKASATSFAIAQCIGKYIFNLDADDWFLAGKIADSIAIFESDDTIVHVASPAKILHQDTGLFNVEKIPVGIIGIAVDGDKMLQYFYNNNILFGGGTTYAARAKILKNIIIPAAVDMYIDEFLILALLPFGKSFIIKEPLSVWRVHQGNYSVGSVSPAFKRQKAQRLLSSSDGILQYLQINNFSASLLTVFRLKNLTERITLLENQNRKKFVNIVSYAFTTFVVLRPNWSQVKNYHVINRLIPTMVFRLLKGFLKKTAV